MKFDFQNPVQGIVKRHPDGFGFLIPDDSKCPDIYISRESMDGVMSNDKIVVEVLKARGKDRLRGRVVKVLSRGFKSVSGRLHLLSPSKGLLIDESHGWGEDLKVSVSPSLKVKDGDWVCADIVTYPDSPRGLTGDIKAVIGNVQDPLNDDKRALFTQGIQIEFPKECLEQAKAFPTEVTEADKKNRKDLTGLSFITIDGQTAKDFDDAVFVEPKQNGFQLKVAIADVSHYVTKGSPIDEEAYKRGNSTYFPNFVVPMLPEALSNELCSLKPLVARCAMVADLHLDFQGEILKSSFYEALIESKARVTYGEAQDAVDGNCPEKIKHVEQNILDAANLAKILMTRRFKMGSLNLEIPETEIEIDEMGEPVDIMQSERLFSHKLIEELMLIANVAVATFLQSKDVPALYRIHEKPASDNLATLSTYLENFGFQKKLSGGKLQKKITKALATFEGQPQEHILSILTLRSMNQAKYSPDNIGHFGLGFQNYSHFTSPIRRYPDLIIHRILKGFCDTQKSYGRYPHDELQTAGEMLSACEQRSAKAERQFNSIKKARFMTRFIGQEFEGMISSVAKFGIFVVLRQYDVDGLVKIEELRGDRYEFDEENLRLVGKKTGFVYSLGDTVKVTVAAADPELGRIDFVLASSNKDPKTQKDQSQKQKKKRNKKKQSKSKKSRRKGRK